MRKSSYPVSLEELDEVQSLIGLSSSERAEKLGKISLHAVSREFSENILCREPNNYQVSELSKILIERLDMVTTKKTKVPALKPTLKAAKNSITNIVIGCKNYHGTALDEFITDEEVTKTVLKDAAKRSGSKLDKKEDASGKLVNFQINNFNMMNDGLLALEQRIDQIEQPANTSFTKKIKNMFSTLSASA